MCLLLLENAPSAGEVLGDSFPDHTEPLCKVYVNAGTVQQYAELYFSKTSEDLEGGGLTYIFAVA
jgi:hypothetical protein